DFNRDGQPDLAVTRSNGIAILLGGRGDGFTARPSVSPKTSHHPTVADFNGDGIPDLAVQSASRELTVLLGDGTGGFAAASGSPTNVGVPSAIADFDGDGKADLLASAGSGKLTVLLGDGSGRFTAAPASPFASGSTEPSSVVVADFNRDGKPDLAVGGGYDAKYLLILFGSGNGRFGAPTRIPLPESDASALAVADFNRDSKADLAAYTSYNYGLTILLGDGRGSFRRASHFQAIGQGGDAAEVAVADLHDNGVADLAVAAAEGGEVAVWLGNGRGGFHPAGESPLPILGDGEIATGDFNGDRRVDLVLSNAHGVTILFQTRSTPAVRRSRTPGGGPDAVLSVPQPVDDVAADGSRATTCSEGRGSEGRVIVWQAGERRSVSLKTAGYCAAPGLGGGQLAWIFDSSGNTREGEELYVFRPSGGKGKSIDSTDRNRAQGCSACAGSYLGNLHGGGSLLAYNRWFCGKTDPATGECEQASKQRLVRIVGGRPVVVRRGNDAYPLRAVGGGRMAVVSDGAVAVLAAHGSRVARVAALGGQATRAVALSKTRLAVQRTFALDLYAAASGRKLKSLPLGPAAGLELVGLGKKLALLKGRHRLVLVRLSDGKLVSLPLHGVIGATLTEAGLFYAYNTSKGAMKGHVVFEPTAKLLRRF
ncbi:MAG: FG-GAP repeat domain-containing protein, partial [Solirubrobacterales bacterium]